MELHSRMPGLGRAGNEESVFGGFVEASSEAVDYLFQQKCNNRII